MKYNKAINSFSSGQLGESLRSRFDIPQYNQGASLIENFIPKRTGGAERRGGTIYRKAKAVGDTLSDAQTEILIPYTYRDEEFLIGLPTLEADMATAKWYKLPSTTGDGENLVEYDYSADSQYTKAGFSSAEKTQYTQIGKYLVVVKTDGTIPPLVFFYNDGLQSTGAPIEAMEYISWDTFTNDKPLGVAWLPPNIDTSLTITPTLLNPKALEDSKFIPKLDRDDTTLLTASEPFFTTAHVGHFIRLTQLDLSAYFEGIALITEYTDATHVNCREIVGFVNETYATHDWAMGAWGGVDSVSNKWPQSVTAYQDRLIFGGTPLAPNTVFCSEQGNIKNFMDLKLYHDRIADYDPADPEGPSDLGYYSSLIATDAFSIPIAGSEGIAIKFIIGSNVLFIGTSHRPYIARATSSGFSAITVEVISQKAISCGSVQPVYTTEGFAFVSEDGKQIHLGTYVENTGEYIDKNITLLNEDLALYGRNTSKEWIDYEGDDKYKPTSFTKLAWDKENAHLWALNDRGSLSCLTLEDGAKTAAWSTHYIGDQLNGSETIDGRTKIVAEVTDVCRMDKNLFMYVVRNGSLTTFNKSIESIEDLTTPDIQSRIGSKILLDMCTWEHTLKDDVAYTLPTQYDDLGSVSFVAYKKGTTTAFIIGELDTIRYETYTAVKPPVGTGLDNHECLIGIPYTSTLKTMPIETGDTATASRGDITRIHRADLIVHNTMYAKVFTDYNESVVIDNRETWELETSDNKIDLPHSPECIAIVGVEVDLPMPCTVLGLVMKGVSYE